MTNPEHDLADELKSRHLARDSAMKVAADADPHSVVSELRRLELNNSAFDSFIASVKSDSSIKQIDMHAIASAYIGYSPAKSTSRSELVQKIVDKQALNARQAARMKNQ